MSANEAVYLYILHKIKNYLTYNLNKKILF